MAEEFYERVITIRTPHPNAGPEVRRNMDSVDSVVDDVLGSLVDGGPVTITATPGDLVKDRAPRKPRVAKVAAEVAADAEIADETQEVTAAEDGVDPAAQHEHGPELGTRHSDAEE